MSRGKYNEEEITISFLSLTDTIDSKCRQVVRKIMLNPLFGNGKEARCSFYFFCFPFPPNFLSKTIHIEVLSVSAYILFCIVSLDLLSHNHTCPVKTWKNKTG